MKKGFEQGILEDMDVIACWLSSQDTGESFEKLIETRKKQVHVEIVKLAEDVRELGISDEDFRRQAAIYLLSKQTGTSMVEASELFEKLEQERDRKDEGAYARIASSMRTPKYGSPKESSKIEKTEKPQKEQPQREDVEWVPSSGTVSRYNEIKQKKVR